jgi:uncharacterized protein (UPF0332 family)
MGTVAEHVAKADENGAFAKGLATSTQSDIEWAMTALFYGSLHYIDALLIKKGYLPHQHDTHGKRKQLVTMESDLRKISNEYFDLENFSRKARYFCKQVTAKELDEEAKPAFEAVKEQVQKKL